MYKGPTAPGPNSEGGAAPGSGEGRGFGIEMMKADIENKRSVVGGPALGLQGVGIRWQGLGLGQR